MKFFWPILLICVIFCHAKQDMKKMAKVLQLMKKYSQLTELERKLEDLTDVTTDVEGTDAPNITVDSPTQNIPADEATANMTRKTGNSNANYQIRSFYGFTQHKEDNYFSFFMIFSFIQRLIGRVIKMRLRLLYSTSRLRNLQEALAQSVTSTCNIVDSNKGSKMGTGEDIDYSCTAPKERNMMVNNVNLDTTVDMEIDGETVKFDDVNFSEEAARQADNITDATGSKDSGSNVYRKSSSGLSGGAIAGIVIACVVVLIAAAVAAIMLRKPTPPIENTTVVDLKQDNI